MKRRLVLVLVAVLLAVVAVNQFSAKRQPKTVSSNSPADVPVLATGTTNATEGISLVQSAATGSKFGTLNPYAAALQEPGRSKRAWDIDFLKHHQDAASGDPIEFELTDGRSAKGTVTITQHRDGELSYLSGELTQPEKGQFFFLTPPELGVAGKAVGVVQFDGSDKAYRIEPTGLNGDPELWERRLDEVICVGMPQPTARAMNSLPGDPAEAAPLRPDEAFAYTPSYNSNIVSLQSLPGATCVLLLDFAGGYTPTWGGVYYSKPAGITDHKIRDIWKRIAEDYMPFNINVTTDFQVYNQAPAISRQRVAFTDTPVTAAGVAFYGSWNWGGDTPCWSVYTSGKSAAEVAAHEAGHTLGLSHQGQWNGTTTTNEYYGGHGSGAVGWAPIMGVGYYQPVTTWAKGEYSAADQKENALHIIVSNNNGVDYRVDDTGQTLATARYLEVNPDDSVSGEGVIEATGDTDSFQFTTSGGKVSLTARPVGEWANAALSVTIANSAGVVVASNNPQGTLWARIDTTLAAGSYTFNVSGSGRNNPVTDGFSAYSSLGYYSIVGFVTGARQPTRFTVAESVPNAAIVGVVPPTAAGNLSYTIVHGNEGGTFAINDDGVLTVTNNSLLKYRELATTSRYFAGFELLVDIVNNDNSTLTETNRRVVVRVIDSTAGNPIAASGCNARIIVPYHATTASPQATGLDIPNNWALYQEGLNANAQISSSGSGLDGLPSDGLIYSQADNSLFQLGQYGGTNALMMGNSYPSSGTLVLETPQALNRLSILAVSANGGGAGTFVLNFSNGKQSQVFRFNAQDWYNVTTNVAVEGFGRVRLGRASFETESAGWDNPNLYSTTIDLAALGINETVASIAFTGPPVGGSRSTAVLAISGIAMPSAAAITSHPISVTNSIPSAAATFSVAAMGAPPLDYQWYFGDPGSGVALAGATNSSLTLTSIQSSNAGNYFVIVTNVSGSATSSVSTLTVYRAPQIVRQPAPANSTRAAGESISYSVAANAAAPVFYTWRSNGVAVLTGSSSSLSLLNLKTNHSATYTVVVFNSFGSVTSSPVALTIARTNYPYSQLVLSDNPIGYWRLSELSGTVAMDCVGTNNGTYNNTLLGQPGFNWVDTHTSARFGLLASQNSYAGGIPIDFGSAPNQSLTVEAWVKGNVPSTDAGLVTKGTGGGGEQFNLDCGGAGRAFRFFVRRDDGNVVGASSSVVPNGAQWQHVVGVLNRSAGYVAIYVNGVSNASSTFPTENYRGLLRSTSGMSIGARQAGSGAFNNQFAGYMQDVAVYNYALSPAQVLNHFNAAANRPPVFANDLILRPAASAGRTYVSTINTEAADPNGDPLTFAKVSGPAWLAVGTTGTLSGTPANENANTNVFVVSARDSAGLSNTATLTIHVNASPTFTRNPFRLPDLLAGQSLAADISTNVTDLNGDLDFAFEKLSGSAWVEVAANGTVSGTPLPGDMGTNSVVVSVTDPSGLSDSALMTVYVSGPMSTPVQVFLSKEENDLLLTWTGGTPPYHVEANTDLYGTNWTSIGVFPAETSLMITPTNAATFYRVIGN